MEEKARFNVKYMEEMKLYTHEEMLAFASNAFNTLVPFYAAVDETPEYLANTTKEVSTENFYWSARMIAAMADASFAKSAIHIERYQNAVEAKGHALLKDRKSTRLNSSHSRKSRMPSSA